MIWLILSLALVAIVAAIAAVWEARIAFGHLNKAQALHADSQRLLDEAQKLLNKVP